MFGKNKDSKQPKVNRHEIGRQKCKIYQRSASGNFRTNQSTQIKAVAGQFAIQHHQQIKLTTNIKQIMKDHHAETTSNFLSLNVSRKNSISKSANQLIKINNHPQQTEGQREASFRKSRRNSQENITSQTKEVDNKNSYQVRAKIQTPKYLQGFRIIKLDNPQKLKLNNIGRQREKSEKIEKCDQQEQAHFLPVQYYLLDVEQPLELMNKYKMGESDYVLGYSKWYDLDGSNSWKKCRVLRYNTENARYEIEWLHNCKRKEVSRINLYFQGQNKKQFESKIIIAYKYRKLSEIFYKYNLQIDNLETSTHQLNEKRIQSIVSMIHTNYGIAKIQKLLAQVKVIYIRSNHQAEFNASLPYNKEAISVYGEYLPKYLFSPFQQYKMRYTNSKCLSISEKSKDYFKKAQAAFIQKTSLANKYRLLILEYMNNLQFTMKDESFFNWKKDKIYCLEQIIKIGESKINEFIREINCVICDIEHHIGNEIDKQYVGKSKKPDELHLQKSKKAQQFEKTIKKYNLFLSMIIIRLQNVVRSVFINTIQKIYRSFEIKVNHNPLTQINDMRIEIALLKKESKIYFEPSPETTKKKILQYIGRVIQILQTIPIPSKSYLNEQRREKTLAIAFQKGHFNQQQGQRIMHYQLVADFGNLNTILSRNCQILNSFSASLQQISDDLFEIMAEVKKSSQKKNTFTDIQQLTIKLNDIEKRLIQIIGRAISPNQNKFQMNAYLIKAEDAVSKLKKNHFEVKRELYKLVLDKIIKQNQKIEKLINSLEERLQNSPSNIIQMLALEKLIKEQAAEELEKINIKIRQIPSKLAILQNIDKPDYRDYETCNRIYILPIKLRLKMVEVKGELESTYRKKFGEQLNQDAGRVLQITRQCNEELLQCFRIESLKEMCEKFMQFSHLYQSIQKGIQSAQLINDREDAMSWSRTDFSKLFQIDEELTPYFNLVSLGKNYQIHLQLLSVGPFHQIQYQKLKNQLTQSNLQLIRIMHIFNKNPRMLKIAQETQILYKQYSDNLPLIKVLRNPDLRERHLVIIRQIININPQDEAVSLKLLIASGVKQHLVQLEEISDIATKELLYEKKLIKLKRQWKQIRLLVSSNTETFKTITNIKEIRQRVQNDIFHIQQMLAASFIKFLEADILCWRNQVLYKAYQLLEKWEQVQNQVNLVSNIFSKQKSKIQLSGEYIRFQILQKAWRGLCNQVESQPWLSDVLQGKAYDFLTNLQYSIERIKKQIYSYFEEKKTQYARLACLSDDQFVNLLSCDETDTRESAIFEQTVRKCFQNIKGLVRNEQNEIIKIRTKSNQQIDFTPITYLEKIVEYILPNESIVVLEKKIHRQLKSSLQKIVKSPHSHTAQVLLLYHRLNFTLRIEDEIMRHHSISASFVRELQMYKDELIVSVLKNPPLPKTQCQLLQALYHLQITSCLWQYQFIDIRSFYWLSQPRFYMRGQDYYVQIGILSELYGFQIVDIDNIVIEEWSARAFCSYAGAIRQKGFCLIQGGCNGGKTASIKKLAALFGHKQFILDSTPLVSARNLIEYLRMAASGIWVILRDVQRLTSPQLSTMARNLQVCWVNHMTKSKEGYYIDGTGIKIKTNNIKIFATFNIQNHQNQKDLQQINHFKSYFRQISMSEVDLEFIIGVKLLIFQFENVSSGRICTIIQFLIERLGNKTHFYRKYSGIFIAQKLFDHIKRFKQEKCGLKWGEQIIQQSFIRMVNELIKEEEMKQKILRNLHQTFNFTILNIETENCSLTKDEFINLKLHFNQSILQSYDNLTQSLASYNFIILVGPRDSGKSNLINMLVNSKKIDLTFICPNAYNISDLYGADSSNGAICCLIEDALAKLKQGSGMRKGIVFDGEMDLWIEPLASSLSSGHIIQPNGNTLLIQQQVKFIFECQDIKAAPPSLILFSFISVIKEPLKWQSIFTTYLNTKFNERYRFMPYIKFLQLFIPYIVDPLIQFYQSSCNQQKIDKNLFISSNSLVLSLLRLFQSLLDYHFLESKIEQLSEKICSDSFNLFVVALVWAFGVTLPQQTRRSFSRHFKYLIKRAVQVNIQGVNKQSLPEDDQDLFKIFYAKDKWVYWNQNALAPLLTPLSPNIFTNKPEDIGLTFIMQRLLQKSHSVFIRGHSSTQKTTFLQTLLQRLNNQVFNIKKIIFTPNSDVSQLKRQILHEMAKEKYNQNFDGFVHGKKTLISIRDLNLPLVKNAQISKLSVHQFIRHYYITKGWYLKDSPQHYAFKNIVFTGTINAKYSLPLTLLKYSSIVFRPTQKEDLLHLVTNIFQKSPLNTLGINLAALIINLHSAICRQLSLLSIIQFENSDALNIARSLINMGETKKIEVFRRWIFVSEKIYQQKLLTEQKERLFYLINNVLMEQQKIRYKSIKPNPSQFYTYFPSKQNYYSLQSMKSELQKQCMKMIAQDQISQVRSKGQRKESKIQQFAATELKVCLNQGRISLLSAKKNSQIYLKNHHVRLISHIINTFQIQTSFILALTIIEDGQVPYDLEECLDITAILRSAKLLNIKLGEASWNNNEINGTWRDIILGSIEQILSSMQRNQPLKEVIICLDQFTSDNDYILDDLVNIKRIGILPFNQLVGRLLDYFIDNFGKQIRDKTGKYPQNNDQYASHQGKLKIKQRKYELERKQREKNYKIIYQSIISKLKFVINLEERSMSDAKSNMIYKCYSEALRQFSILNLSLYKQQNEYEVLPRSWDSEAVLNPSFGLARSRTIITELNQQQMDESDQSQDQQLEENEPIYSLRQDQQTILQNIHQMVINKCFLQPEQKWLRGKNINLKRLYYCTRLRLDKLCHSNIQLIDQRIQNIRKITCFDEFIKIQRSKMQQRVNMIIEQCSKIKKDQQDGQMQYENCMEYNNRTEVTLVNLKKEHQELHLTFEQLIEKPRKQFFYEKQNLLQLIRNMRDRKIGNVNSQFKIYVQILGLLTEKRIKKDEEMYKEIIKEINSAPANLKINKKISNIAAAGHYNVPERVSLKIKDYLQEIETLKAQKKIRPERPEEREKQESIMDKFIKQMKNFSNKLIEFYLRNSEKDIKQCLRRFQQNQKQQQKLKEAQAKTIKSSQYKQILERYEWIRQKIIELENQLSLCQLKVHILENISAKMDQFFAVNYPTHERCSNQNEHANCSFICWLDQQLKNQRQKILQISENVQSYALTLTLKFYYKEEQIRQSFKQIINMMTKLKKIKLGFNNIDILQNLYNLKYLRSFHLPQDLVLSTRFEQFNQAVSCSLFGQKQIFAGNIVSLIQFVPGIFILSCSNKNSEKQSLLRMEQLKCLDQSCVIDSHELVNWIRNRNNQFSHQAFISSKVMLENKCFPKSSRSIAIKEEDSITINTQKLCLIQVNGRQQLKNLIGIVKREHVGPDLSIVFITDSQNAISQQNIIVLQLKNQDSQQLLKKIDDIVSFQSEKSELALQSELFKMKLNKQKMSLIVSNYITIFDINLIDYLQNSFKDTDKSNLEVLMTGLAEVGANVPRVISQQQHSTPQVNKHGLMDEEILSNFEKNEEDRMKRLVKWINSFVKHSKRGFEILREENRYHKLITEKNKYNHSSIKISAYFVRLYETISYLQQKRRIEDYLCVPKYLSIIKKIFQKNKEINKKTINYLKCFSQIRLIAWNFIACLYPKNQLLLLLIFTFALQLETSSLDNQQKSKLIDFSLENYQQGIIQKQILENESGQSQIISMFLKENDQIHSQTDNLGPSQIELTDKLIRKLQKLQKITKKQMIIDIVKDNKREWLQYFSELSESTCKIPFDDDSSKLLTFFFITLVKPHLAEKWILKLDSQNYLSHNNSTEGLIVAKKNQVGLHELSHYNEWSNIKKRLLYQQTSIDSKTVILVNININEIIQYCINFKVGLCYIDFGTICWQIDKRKEIRQLRLKQEEKCDEKSKEEISLLEEQKKVIEEIKNSIKNQSWILVNLNHHKLSALSIKQYYTKTKSLIQSLLPENTEGISQHLAINPTKFTRINNHNIEFNLFKYMVIYFMDNPKPDQSKALKQIARTEKIEIIRQFAQQIKSYVFVDNTNRIHKNKQLKLVIANFKEEFYLNLHNSKKCKKDYEKLTFSQKKMIFELVQISHCILQDFMNSDESKKESCSYEYIIQTISRIFGCANIIKNGPLLSETEQLELKTFFDQKQKVQKSESIEQIILKISEYISIMVEYIFLIIYKKNIQGRNLHASLQFVKSINLSMAEHSNYQIQHIIGKFNMNNKFNNIQQKLVQEQTSVNVIKILTNFRPEGISLELDEKRQSESKSQEQKLLSLFLNESKLDYATKRKQISQVYKKQIDIIVQIIERVKLYDLKYHYDQYRSLSTMLASQNINLQKYIAQDGNNGGKWNNGNLNTAITYAITDIFNKENSPKVQTAQRCEIQELQYIFGSALNSLKTIIQSSSLFLQEIRDIVKQYIEIQFQRINTIQGQILDESSDEEENIRANQEQEIKILIRNRVQSKIAVDRLYRKLIALYRKMFLPNQSPVKIGLTLRQQRLIHSVIMEVQQSFTTIRIKTEESIRNYLLFESQRKQKTMKIEGSIYEEFKPSQFVFRFNQHEFISILSLMKIVHAKKYHQELHLLKHNFTLRNKKRKANLQDATLLYFKGFKLVNGVYQVTGTALDITANIGQQASCEQLFIEVSIQEEFEIDSQQEIVDLRQGFSLFKVPLYIKERDLKTECRTLVTIEIKEDEEQSIRRANVYFMSS